MSTDALWYLGRGTGVSALVLLSLVVALGLLVRAGWSSPTLPRFVVSTVHRTTSLTAVGLLAVHVCTLLLDPYAQLRLTDLVVPFLGTYRPVWQGLGTVALDLVALLVASSLLRDRLGRRTWRALHWTAYLCWPVAVAHAIGNGTDGTSGWLLALTGLRRRGRRRAGGAAAVGTAYRSCRGPGAHRAPGVPGGPAMSRPVPAPQRLLGAAVRGLADHERLLGALPSLSGAALLRAAAESGLTGHGGAAFSTARKLAAVAAAPDPVVVANGAEGEPASSKDRVLLTTAPHLVLDGLQLAARATGAGTAYLFAPEHLLRSTLRPALQERRDELPVTAVASPDAFLSGEESAVVQAVQGNRAVPTSTPPRVFERGVDGRATLVQNVETLAHLALLARFGAAWFREAGTPEEPGTQLLTVSGAVARPAVVEVAGGVALAEALALAGGASEPLGAVLVGGYHGAWLPPEALDGVALSRPDLAPYGAAPGAGVVLALPRTACGLRAGADLAGYLAGQGARQCGPCRNGLPSVARTLRALADGRPSPALVAEVERVSRLVEHRGACHHPDGTVRLVRSTLRTFGGEVRHHLAGRCTARPGAPTEEARA